MEVFDFEKIFKRKGKSPNVRHLYFDKMNAHKQSKGLTTMKVKRWFRNDHGHNVATPLKVTEDTITSPLIEWNPYWVYHFLSAGTNNTFVYSEKDGFFYEFSFDKLWDLNVSISEELFGRLEHEEMTAMDFAIFLDL